MTTCVRKVMIRIVKHIKVKDITMAMDANKQKHLLIANFTEEEKQVDLTLVASLGKLESLTCPGKNIHGNELLLKPFTAHLFCHLQKS